MRYLTLSADYRGFSVQDEAQDRVVTGELRLAPGLLNDLRAWNQRYEPIVPMSMATRQEPENARLIAELDHEGVVLAKRIAEGIGGSIKVRYYSEGHLRHLSVA